MLTAIGLAQVLWEGGWTEIKYDRVPRESSELTKRPGRVGGLIKERNILNFKYLLYQFQSMQQISS